MNFAIFVGKIVELPQLKETNNGVKFATMTIEVDRNFRNVDGAYEKDLIHFTLWRGIAEEAIVAAKVNDYIAVKARVQSRSYESEQGNIFYNYEYIAEKISFLN